MTAPAAFRQADVTRLIRGAIKAGYHKDELRLTATPDGAISLSVQSRADNDDHAGTGWEDA